jgi:methylenetetrahydrofolate reductase (NADPH)
MTGVATLIKPSAAALPALLDSYSVELTSRDKKSIEGAAGMIKAGTEVFIAALPGDSIDRLVGAAVSLREAGMIPVPHIVARNIESRAEMDELLRRLVAEAGVDRVLALGGDRDNPAGEFNASLQLIETGLFAKHGVRRVAIGCYPEGHPRIDDKVLDDARAAKLAALERAGHEVLLVSQFCFSAEPILGFARRLRDQGVKAPFRVGVAGPADRAVLIKYAVMCGVGASLRALKERHELAKSVMTGETPEALLTEVAEGQAREPELGIEGVHFFTFGSVGKSVQFAETHRGTAG